MAKTLSDGWHTIAGYHVYVEDGLVRRPDFYGSLYRWCSEYNCYTNILPCWPGKIRYWARIGKLIAK